MTRDEFEEAWRVECREWFALLAVVRKERGHAPVKKMGQWDPEAEAATARQRVLRGDLLLDRIETGTLVVEGFADPNRLVDPSRRVR